jgi:5'-nucleotidase
VGKKQILLTNDDGIRSPGLWAAAAALSEVGYVHVVAPREQSSGAGRSMPPTSDGRITVEKVRVNDKEWTVYSVGGSPAQAVQHGILEIVPGKPDLVFSGINYGENLGTGITVSGTVGAALEGAALGVPSIAISLETEPEHHLSYSLDIDFSIAAHFGVFFAHWLLENDLPQDVNLLKIDVPAGATLQTPWEITRVSTYRYYSPVPPQRSSWEEPAQIGYRRDDQLHRASKDSDVYAVHARKIISVTPISLDLTSRVDLKLFERQIRES